MAATPPDACAEAAERDPPGDVAAAEHAVAEPPAQSLHAGGEPGMADGEAAAGGAAQMDGLDGAASASDEDDELALPEDVDADAFLGTLQYG